MSPDVGEAQEKLDSGLWWLVLIQGGKDEHLVLHPPIFLLFATLVCLQELSGLIVFNKSILSCNLSLDGDTECGKTGCPSSRRFCNSHAPLSNDNTIMT